MNKEECEKAFDELSRLAEEQEAAQQRYETENEAWWNGLSQREREDAFYAVVKRIVQGELREQGSYRYILYDIFGFGPGYYGLGMDCGFMELHNSIYTQQEMRELHDRELAAKGVKVEKTRVEIKE